MWSWKMNQIPAEKSLYDLKNRIVFVVQIQLWRLVCCSDADVMLTAYPKSMAYLICPPVSHGQDQASDSAMPVPTSGEGKGL